MGFLRRLLGGSAATPRLPTWPPPGPITAWPAHDAPGVEGHLRVVWFDPPANGGTVEVAGESHYQGSLTGLADGFTINGPRLRDHRAILLPEPDNPYDPHAVRVVIVSTAQPPGRSAIVGYLSRADAVAYRGVVDRVAGLGYVTGCLASLKGGQERDEGGRNYIGVTLYLGTPKALMAEVDADAIRPAWEQG